MAEAELMKYLKFDRADLEANRAGRFSAAQQERLVKQDQAKRSGRMFGGGIAAAVAVISFIAGLITLATSQDATTRLEFGIAFCVVVPLVFGLFAFLNLRVALGSHQLRLASAEGEARVIQRRYSGGDSGPDIVGTELQLGGRKVKGAAGMQAVFRNGSRYRLYFVEGTDTIVSAEELG